MKLMYALVCAVCMAVTPAASQFQGFRTDNRIRYPFIPTVPMQVPMWIGQNRFMGFPSNMGMVMPQPMWTGFQQWRQPTNWQTSRNNNNNFNPTVNTNNVATSTSTSGQSTDPWETYKQFSTGMNSVVGGTQTMSGSNPIVSSNLPVNGLRSNNYPWNTFASNSQNFPIIPNMANTGFIGATNNMNTGNGGLMNNQLTTSSFPQNGDINGDSINSGNSNLGNSQFATSSFPQNGGFNGNSINSGISNLGNSLFATSGFPQNGGLNGNSINSGINNLGNSQFATSGFPQNGGLNGNSINSGNSNLGNSQFATSSFPQNGRFAGNQNGGILSQTQGLNNQFQWS